LDLPHAEMSRYGLIYYGFLAAAADGELHPKELQAIQGLGKKIGLTDEEIEQLHGLYLEHEALRRKRQALLYPKGFDYFLTDFNKNTA